MKYNFSGKVALVTGSTSGIGFNIAKKLRAVGCRLICTTSNLAGLNKLKQHFPDSNSIVVDFKKDTEVEEFLKAIEDTEIDILINCAGLFPLRRITDSSVGDFNDCFDVNVKAPFNLCRDLGKKMKQKRSGRIINIGSSSSYNGSADAGLYSASKHALLGLTRSLYQELKPYNVRVYSLSPGSCQTPMGKTDTRQDYTTFIQPEEVANIAIHMMEHDGEGIMEEVRVNRTKIR